MTTWSTSHEHIRRFAGLQSDVLQACKREQHTGARPREGGKPRRGWRESWPQSVENWMTMTMMPRIMRSLGRRGQPSAERLAKRRDRAADRREWQGESAREAVRAARIAEHQPGGGGTLLTEPILVCVGADVKGPVSFDVFDQDGTWLGSRGPRERLLHDGQGLGIVRFRREGRLPRKVRPTRWRGQVRR